MRSQHSKIHLARPAYICGRIVLEFFGNDEEEFKIKALKDLCKELRKSFNLSANPIDDNLVENPERGVLVFSLTAVSLEQANTLLDKVSAYIDAHCPARIIDESYIKEEFV
jgi:uncharacterized protein YlxP (DUF503 family)